VSARWSAVAVRVMNEVETSRVGKWLLIFDHRRPLNRKDRPLITDP